MLKWDETNIDGTCERETFEESKLERLYKRSWEWIRGTPKVMRLFTPEPLLAELGRWEVSLVRELQTNRHPVYVSQKWWCVENQTEIIWFRDRTSIALRVFALQIERIQTDWSGVLKLVKNKEYREDEEDPRRVSFRPPRARIGRVQRPGGSPNWHGLSPRPEGNMHPSSYIEPLFL